MHQLHKLLMMSTAIASLVGLPLAEKVVQAQEAAIIQCIQKYTSIGISPDAALAQCQKTNLANCVKNLMNKKYVAKSVSESDGRYLVDLGDNETRWLEGQGWKEKGCVAHTKGSYKRQSDKYNFFSGRRSYEWFRQGWCAEPQIELEQNYSIDEAKTFCELGLQPQKLSPGKEEKK